MTQGDATSELSSAKRHIRNFAHRGASGRAPENTLLAFRYAFELGADAIECDVRLSADGAPVILHDATLDRTTNGRGAVAALSLEALRQFDAGAGERIPTLQEVLDLCREAQKLVNLEVKAESPTQALAIARVVGQIVEQGRHQARTLVSSFWLPAIAALKRAHPTIHTATLHSGLRWRFFSMLRAARESGASAIHPHSVLVSRRRVEEAHAAGLEVNVWTVDSPKTMLRLLSWEVDGIMTNYPEVLRRALLIPGENRLQYPV
jgi:glycerophosphoryl diester phosphodiesterase